jgi:PKD repeat protein
LSEKSKRRLELSITAVFVLALLLVGAVLIFTGGAASAKQIATLHLFGGTVDVRKGGSGDFRPVAEGASLHEGDTVRTGPTGRASVVYFDGSLTRLDYDTTFTLVTLETLNNASDSKVIEGEQGDGSSYNRVAELTDAASRFEVETPTVTASVQGTAYALIVEDGATTVAVVDGVVEATGNDASVSVPAGKMVNVDAEGSIGVPQDLSREVLNSPWLSFNLCDIDHDDACVTGESVTPPTEPVEPNADKEPPHTRPGVTPTPTIAPHGGNGDGNGGGSGGSGSPPPNAPPTAGFTATPDEGRAPLRVQFADASSDPDGDPISRRWSFGDGSSRNGGTSPTHTFRDPGTYTVTLTIQDPDGATDHKSKVIDVGSPPAGFDHIVISPSNATIPPGGSQIYAAEAFDTQGHSMGSVTANTSFSIAPNGSCTGDTCTANQPGNHTVTGTFSGDSDFATLVVEEPLPPPCPNYALAFHTRPPDSIDAGGQFNVQVRVDVLQGGSNEGPLIISLSLGGGSLGGGDSSQTWTGEGTVTFNHLSIDQPGIYSITATAPCASPADPAWIVVTEKGNSNTLALVLAGPELLAARRRRRRPEISRARRQVDSLSAPPSIAGYAPVEPLGAVAEPPPPADAPEA